ncbi:hypothetical protein JHN61_06085 [Streptomyces sp. MBT67]|uniref:hypothetical protein n=1 Tax=unclassified Streptomyces TaxID=2593676 RepID=UPI00190D855F|nr:MULTISPECIES: hypothetical protein [unclassified Streptomyces]MBK3531302.1 hypothetical protein [Streptomyces sp. MBT72]MBK3535778.1 hypothetical protein [Streptomyces sp. MBT67]MBK3549153.1 hypothetical protein [Streptomyces sp. MBT61]MBK6029189.1 hypothetical protein [Streptomyces sp. MBT59]
MTYRFTSAAGDRSALTAEPVVLRGGTDRAEPAVAVRISSGGMSRMLYVTLDHIDEVLTGIADTARQAAADFHHGA